MEWTSEHPTEPGYYWHRHRGHPDIPPDLLLVYVGEDEYRKGGEDSVGVFYRRVSPLRVLKPRRPARRGEHEGGASIGMDGPPYAENMSGEWFGPLTPPA